MRESVSRNRAQNLDEITYDYVGIVPEEFYQGRFAGAPCAPDFLSISENRYDIEYDRARFLCQNILGSNILDVGCGSAPYANTIKSNTNAKWIAGVDLDQKCIEYAKQSYDEAMTFSLGKKLPFKDKYFDTVFSVDLFGHIEFHAKDGVIEEIVRVTASGGRSVHIIECGDLDYFKMDPMNPDCPIRQYVYQEGHIGIESSEDLKNRWLRYFKDVRIENAFIYPFAPLAAFDAAHIPDKLRCIIKSWNDEERKSAQIMMGFVNNRLKEGLRRVDPRMLFPDENHPLAKCCGLVYLIADNPRY